MFSIGDAAPHSQSIGLFFTMAIISITDMFLPMATPFELQI